MPAHRDLDPFLLRRARSGDLTRRNTTPGTPERRAVDRVTYLKRRARYSDLSAREALGHGSSWIRPPRISVLVDDPPRFIILEGLGRRDLSRAGRYGDLIQKLDAGRLSPIAFRAKVRRWRPIAGFRFLSDPDAVLLLLERRRAEDREVFYADSGRV